MNAKLKVQGQTRDGSGIVEKKVKPELFSITCDTCASRLKVRNRSAIGQILSCPKCGSMIKVEAPDGWVPPESASQVVDDSDLTDLRNGQQATATKSAATQKPQRQVVVGQSSKKKASPKKQVQKSGDQPVLPDSSWTNQSAKNKQKIALMICAAAGVLILALSLIGFLVVRSSNHKSKKPDDIAKETSHSKVEFPSKKAEDKKSADKKTETKKESDPKSKSGNAKESEKDKSQKKPVISGSDGKDDKKKADEKGAENPLVVRSETKNGAGKADAKKTAKAAPLNPEMQKNKTSLLDKLGQTSALIRNQNTTSDLRAGTNTIDHEESIGIGKIHVAKPVFKAPKIDVFLNSRIPEIALPEMPLSKFVNTISRLSNIPIKLDIDSFQYKALDFKNTVKYSGKDTNYLTILEETLHPLGLEFVKKDWGLIVRPTDLDKVITRNYEIFELEGAEDKEYEGVTQFLTKQFVPNSWFEKGGPGQIKREGRKFSIQQTAKLHFFIEQYFKKLNEANEIKLGKLKADEAKSLMTNWSSISKAMSATSELSIIVAKPIQDVLAKVESETGMTILIDWESLVSEGWTLRTNISWEGKGKPVEKTLTETLRSMQLGMRVVDAKTIEITSRKRVNRALTFEVYSYHEILEKIPRGLFQDRVSGAFSDKINVRSGMYAYFDDASDSIISILPQPLHRRLEKIIQIMSQEK